MNGVVGGIVGAVCEGLNALGKVAILVLFGERAVKDRISYIPVGGAFVGIIFGAVSTPFWTQDYLSAWFWIALAFMMGMGALLGMLVGILFKILNQAIHGILDDMDRSK